MTKLEQARKSITLRWVEPATTGGEAGIAHWALDWGVGEGLLSVSVPFANYESARAVDDLLHLAYAMGRRHGAQSIVCAVRSAAQQPENLG